MKEVREVGQLNLELVAAMSHRTDGGNRNTLSWFGETAGKKVLNKF